MALAALILAPGAQALDIDFSGEFEYDSQVEYVNFDVTYDSTVTIFTSSWVDLGFDPEIQLWDAGTQELLAAHSDNGSNGTESSNGTDYDYGELDVYFQQFLSVGSYVVTITQYDNLAAGDYLWDGWTREREHEYTQDYGSEEFFNGMDGSARTGEWALHVTNISTAPPNLPVPEPASITLLGLGLAGLAYRYKRK